MLQLVPAGAGDLVPASMRNKVLRRMRHAAIAFSRDARIWLDNSDPVPSSLDSFLQQPGMDMIEATCLVLPAGFHRVQLHADGCIYDA